MTDPDEGCVEVLQSGSPLSTDEDVFSSVVKSHADYYGPAHLASGQQTPKSLLLDPATPERSLGLRPLRPHDSASSPFLRGPSDAKGKADLGTSARLAWNKAEASKARPQVGRQLQDVYVNIMVAGESGQGKTTCIENLFAAYHPRATFGSHDGSSTSIDAFKENPQQLLARLPPVELDDPAIRLHYAIQDTPGYGNELDPEDTLALLVDHVRAGKANQAAILKSMPQGMQLPGVELRHMLDVCLYFIPAHRLKVIDLYFMAALSRELAVIPIIAKSDCMTAAELADFKSHILSRLINPDVEGIDGPIDIYNFPGHVLEDAGVDRPLPPFAVVCSKDMGPSGSFWPVRRYKWGDCECANYEHSDFQLLKELVFEKGFEALRQDKWRRYLRYTSGQDAHQLPLRLGRRSRGFESLADWQALYTQLVRFCRHLPHSLLALALLCVQAVALLGILWLMLSHHRGSEGLQSVLHERIATLPLALNVSTVESGDFERLYAALLQNRAWDWGKMTLLLFWCLPAAFALGMYRAHLAARGRETGLQSYRVQDLLARMQSPVPDKALQGSVMPAAALSLGSMLGDDVLQDRRTLSASVNTLHDMLGHLNPVCQQAAAMAMGSLMRNAPPQWRSKLACSSLVDALVPLLRPGHIPRQQAALYCLRIMAVTPTHGMSRPPSAQRAQDLLDRPARNEPPPSWSVSEAPLKAMAECGALPLMVDLGIASGQIATQEAVIAALKLFASVQLREDVRNAFLRRMACIQELPRLLEIVGDLGSATSRRRAEQLEQALADLPVLEFY